MHTYKERKEKIGENWRKFWNKEFSQNIKQNSILGATIQKEKKPVLPEISQV